VLSDSDVNESDKKETRKKDGLVFDFILKYLI